MISDIIEINKATFSCKIGCSEKERSVPQKIEISAKIYIDSKAVALSKNIKDTISWDDILSRFQHLTENKEWVLVEELCEAGVNEIFHHFPKAQAIELNVIKFPYKNVGSVGVSIKRARIE